MNICNSLEKEYQKNKHIYKSSKNWSVKDRVFERNMKILSEMNKYHCPQRKKHNKISWYRCVHDVEKKGSAVNPYAVCTASVGQ